MIEEDDICFFCGQPCFRTGFENACEYDGSELPEETEVYEEYLASKVEESE